MIRMGLIAGFIVSGILFTTSIQPADAAAQRFYDPVTRSWQEVTPGHSMRNPVPREVIDYDGPYGPNTIIIDTSERRLYFVLGDGQAIRYGVGVGREGFQWTGTHRITRKAEWPGWTPPAAMRKRQPGLPTYMEGGPNNPLGARAMYIGSTLYRIHGSNQPWTIGHAVSSGCIRMTNDDVIDLYEQVAVGTKVVVRN